MLLSLLDKTDATLLHNNTGQSSLRFSRKYMYVYTHYMHIHACDVDQIKLMDDEIGLLDTPMLNISWRLS